MTQVPSDNKDASDSYDQGLARSGSDVERPCVLGLISEQVEALVRELPAEEGQEGATLWSETFALERVTRRQLFERLTTVPTIAILVDHPDHLDTVEVLKSDAQFRDVPVIFLTPRADPNVYRHATRVGCDDVVVVNISDISGLMMRLKAIRRYHKKHGFNPPSGHWFSVPDATVAGAHSLGGSDRMLTLRSAQRFIGGEDGSAHVLLISNHPYYRLGGQEALSKAGYHVSFFDSGFMAAQFMQRLAAHQEPNLPDFLQGKLDLVVVAMAASMAQSLQLVRQIKSDGRFAQLPVLVLAESNEDLELLAPYLRHGVYTSVSSETQAEDLIFRIYEIFQRADSRLQGSHRYLFTVPCEYRLLDRGQERWHKAQTYNMNRHGIYIRTISPPRQNHNVALRFRLRNMGVLLEFEGPVVWSTPWIPASRRAYPAGFGVSLRRGAQTDFEALTDFCDVLAES